MVDIVTRILLEGGEQVKSLLRDIGASGRASLEALGSVSAAASRGLESVDQAIRRVSGDARSMSADTNSGAQGLDKLGASGTKAATGVNKAGDAAKKAVGSFKGIDAGVTALLGSISALTVRFGAFGSVISNVVLTGVTRLKATLADIGTAGAAGLNLLTAAGGRTTDSIKGVDGAITRASVSFVTARGVFGQVGAAIGTLGASFLSLASNIAKVIGIVGGISLVLAGLGAGLFALANSASQTVDELRDMAIASGTTVEKFQELGFAAEQSGSHAESLGRALSIINDATGEAISKGARSVGAFEKLGVALVDSSGHARDAGEIFKDIADKVAKLKNPTDQAAAAADIFGRRMGPGLVESLSLGRRGLEDLGQEAEKLNIIFTKAEAEIGDNFRDAIDRLSKATTRFSGVFGLAFAPSFTTLVTNMASAIGAAVPFMERLGQAMSGQLQVGMDAVAAVITNVLIPAFQLVGKAVQALIDGFNSLFGTNLQIEDILAFVVIMTALAIAIGGVLLVVGGLSSVFGIVIGLITSGIGVFTALGGVITTVVTALLSIAETAGVVILALDPIALAIVAVGVAIGVLVGYLATLDWGEVSAGAQTALDSILDAVQATVDFITDIWVSFLGTLQGIWDSIASGAQSLWASVASIFKGGIDAITNGWNSIVSSASSAWERVKSIITSAFSSINSAIQGAIQFMKDLWEWAVKAAQAVAAAVGGGGGGSTGHARGGPVHGPGSGTSDSVPARLSVGEWVIRAAAVRKYGHQLFAALNGMRVPASSVGRMLQGYAQGGPVLDLGALNRQFSNLQIPHFAEGGPVRDIVDLNLSLLGQTFEGLMAPRDVADKLIRFALTEQVKSGGRKPGWYLG